MSNMYTVYSIYTKDIIGNSSLSDTVPVL